MIARAAIWRDDLSDGGDAGTGRRSLADAAGSNDLPVPARHQHRRLTRLVAGVLGDALNRQFVVENRPGASGNISGAAAAKAAPDGYTLMVGTLGPTETNKLLYRNMSYDPNKALRRSRCWTDQDRARPGADGNPARFYGFT